MAALSEVDLCNAALAKVGAALISSLSDSSAEAIVCNQLYSKARDAALRSHPWNFARTWVALAQLQTAPIALLLKPNSEGPGDVVYTTAYSLPGDCLRLFRAAPYKFNFRLVGRTLYTDSGPQTNVTNSQLVGVQPNQNPLTVSSIGVQGVIGIEYISALADTTLFDPMFVDALVAKLAMEIAFPITGNFQLKNDLASEFKEKLLEAWYADGAEQWQDELFNDTLTTVRNTFGGADITNW